MKQFGLIFFLTGFGLTFGCLGGLSDSGNDDGSISDSAITANPSFELTGNEPVAWTVSSGSSSSAAWPARTNGRRRTRGRRYPRNVDFNWDDYEFAADESTTETTPTELPITNEFPDQSTSVDQAMKKANRTIKIAIIEAFSSREIILPSSATFDFSQFKIITVTLIDPTNIPTATANSGVVEGDVVTHKCTGPGACNDPYIVTQVVSIKNGPLLTGRQWKDIALSMQVGLQTDTGFRFTSPIIVTSND